MLWCSRCIGIWCAFEWRRATARRWLPPQLRFGLTLAAKLLMDILYVDNLALEISTSFERILLQLWPAALLAFFLASGPLQLVAAKPQGKVNQDKKANRPARRVAETR